MNTYLSKAVHTYFKTLASHNRTVSKNISPEKRIIDHEEKLGKYLSQSDLHCMICTEPLIVIQIDYKTQRPIWGCIRNKFTYGLQKIKWLDHCSDCGKKMNLEPELLKDQKKHLEQDNVRAVCDNCIGNGNVLQEEDMKNIHKNTEIN